MQITIDPRTSKKFTLDVDPSFTIEVVLGFIESILKIPPRSQVLRFKGRELQDGFTLAHYKIEHNCTLKWSPRLNCGCGRCYFHTLTKEVAGPERVNILNERNKHKFVSSGVNIIGRCKHPGCRIQNEIQWI